MMRSSSGETSAKAGVYILRPCHGGNQVPVSQVHPRNLCGTNDGTLAIYVSLGCDRLSTFCC